MHITNTRNPSAPSVRRRHNSTARLAMRAAWALVRKGQTLYGGNHRQYIAEALRLAWRDLNADPVILEFRSIIRDIRAQKAAGTFKLGYQAPWRTRRIQAAW